jgi:hypothetical protein
MGLNVIQTKPLQSEAVPDNSTVGTADATVFTLAAGEVGFIQNLDDAALHVKLGTGCTPSDFHYVLKAGSAAADGLGGFLDVNDYAGPVSVAAAAGTASYMAWKRVL